MNFDPKLWEGWTKVPYGYQRQYVTLWGDNVYVRAGVFHGSRNHIALHIINEGQVGFINAYETQQEALKVANAIGGWE